MGRLSCISLAVRPYTKPFLSIQDQISLISSRGMLISDAAAAERYLQNIGYYRLSGYWFPMRKSTIAPDGNGGVSHVILDEFRTDSKFSKVIDLYVFDKKLRLLMLDVLERIEIAIRTDVALQMGQYSPWSYRDPSLVDGNFATKIAPHKSVPRFQEFITRFDKMAADSKEDFVEHFRATYSDPLPIWCAVELWDFGMLSVFIGGMKYRDQRAIAAKYNIPRPQLLPTWIRTLAFARNVCAHHSRLWNKSLIAQPKPPKAGEVPLLDHLSTDTYATERFYAAAAIARYFQLILNPSSSWGRRFVDVVRDFPTAPGVAIGQAGFPSNWDNLPLWR